ncbi:hypothetical protein [Sphingomonas nostoxanthinifaciens]|uniref:hypothetical protein n=1 Tax=Sphingomonas nostoxanthinifaciens TaxID=2872652 RepID=UPI001CC1FEBC|nr:hypothetical protein [Sphingomonas nostoxanthinifaciens]UAK24990.1 hypothetical protein K8P63_01890 [Sphingomonas nostoxanthinifaciens]
MAEASVQNAGETAPEVPVDPFDFFPQTASRIGGLGGAVPSQDPYYVFHTGYFEAAPGPSRFIVQFDGLRARRGTLWLRVHMLPMEPGSRAVMANSDRIQLNRLIQHGGRAEIRFEGFRGMSFALYAGIQDDTDAEAAGVSVWFDRPCNSNKTSTIVADIRSTVFGRDDVRPIAHMLSPEPPSFADPVTQVATHAQMDEPSYRGGARTLGLQGDASDWPELYVCQVLSRYGMAQAGAAGLGLQAQFGSLPAYLGRAGVTVTAATTGAGESPAPIAPGVESRSAPLLPLPADLVNFDFLWSIDAPEALVGPAEMLPFVEGTLAALRPGGIAVHVCRYRLRDSSGFQPAAIGRVELERILLVLISRGHEVAQFRFRELDAIRSSHALGHVGFVARKALSAL